MLAIILLISCMSFAQTTKSKTTAKADSTSQISLKEITVTSLRANEKSPVAYTNVSKEAISKNNLGQDIPYLLALTPSFITTSDAGTGIGYTGFRIRGTDANRTNITVNGVPLNDAESHGTFFVNMPDFASSLSSVQVQRGVGTSTNGAAAFGASINMQTEQLNVQPYAEISTTLGSFRTNKNTLKAGTGLMKSGFAFDARLSNVTSDGYIDRAWVDMASYYFAAGYYQPKTTIKFLTFGGKEKTYQAWYGVDPITMATNRTYNEAGRYFDNAGQTKFYDNQTDNYKQTHYQLHWLQEFSSALHLNMTAHYTKGAGYYEEYKSDRSYKEYGLIPDTVAGVAIKKTDLVRQKWLDNDFYGLTFALNYKNEGFNATFGGAVNSYDGNHFGKVIWVKNATKLDVANEFYRSKSKKDDANIYAKVNAEVIDGLFLIGDLQYRYINYHLMGFDDKYDYNTGKMRDLTQNHVFHFVNPKLGATYELDKNSNVYASYSISNREPNRNNYTERGLDEPLPKSEVLFDKEIGYRYATSDLTLSANMYLMNYKNQLILTGKLSEIGEALTTNIDNSYRAGVELSAGIKLTEMLRWDVNATLSQNKILNYVDNTPLYNADYDLLGYVSVNMPTTNIAFSPNFIGNSLLTAKIDGFELGLHSNFVSKQYLDNTSSNDRSLNSYFVNNFRFKYSCPLKNLKALEIQLLLNNILNVKYESNGWAASEYYEGDNTRYNYIGYYPQAGFNFLTSITLKF